MNLPLHIARRYLFTRKSHNAVHLVSLVSVLGVAAATLAMVCVLSAFNGFQDLLSALYSNFDPDIKITTVKGKAFNVDTLAFETIRRDPRVAVFSECVEDNCLARYKDSQMRVVVKGVPDNFSSLTNMEECLYVGSFTLEDDGIYFACAGTGVTAVLGTGYSLIDPIQLYAPRRTAKVNLANPASSFKSQRILLSGMFCIGQPEYDDSYVIVPLDFARELFEYGTGDATSVELKVYDSRQLQSLKEDIRRSLGDGYQVQDLQEQKAAFFHVTRMEKYVTFLMLSFILLIALFNVIGSLSMLILEKKNDASVLSGLGADDFTVRRIFVYEGWMIAAIGGLAGILSGTALCIAQQQFGFLKLGGGGFIVDAYPVVVRLSDLILVLLTVMAVSIPSILWPVRYILGPLRSKEKNPGVKSATGLFIVLSFFALPLQAQHSYGGNPLDETTIREAMKHSLVKCLNPEGVVLPSFNVDSVREIDSMYANIHGAVRFAQRIPVDINPDNSGETFFLEDGTKVWRVSIRSEGAKSLNVIFDTFNIPPGARLFLYNSDRSEVLGSFTAANMQESGELPTAPVAGDELIIEYQEPPGAAFPGRLQIYGVNHDYLGLRAERNFNHLKLSCIDPLSCSRSHEDAGRSVCLLILEGIEYCTGVFLNNTREDGIPYILTASHCFSAENAALGSRTLVFMNYESPRCMTEIQGSEEFSLSGCTTRAISKAGDFALLELDELPPADFRPYLAGWNISSADSANAPFTCIHHPDGEGKSYAVEDDSIIAVDWTFGQGISKGIHWNVAQWEHSHTWSGSSGAPLFDNDGAVVGILSGGDSGGEAGCDSSVLGDFFVRMDKVWVFQAGNHLGQLKCWLDPDGIGLTSIQGLDPYKSLMVERQTNIRLNDSIECFHFQGYGYLFGTNDDGFEVAEEFHTDSTCSVLGVYLMPSRGWKSKSHTISVKVYDGRQQDSVLYETILNPSSLNYVFPEFYTEEKSIYANKENFVRFDSAVYVGNHFLVACAMERRITAVADTFALYGAHTPVNTAWYQKDGWQPYPVHPLRPGVCSIWMEPVTRYTSFQPVPPATPDTSVRQQEEVILVYDASTRTVSYCLPKDWYASLHVDVYDLTGKHLLSVDKQYGDYEVQLPSDISKGVYLLKMYDINHVFSRLFVLK